MTDFSQQSRGRWFTVSVHTDLISHSATESFYAGDAHFALARFLRKSQIVSLLLSGAVCWFTVEEEEQATVGHATAVQILGEADQHPFATFPGGRFPNACIRCGRTREASVHQLESPPTPDTGDDDGTRASEEPDA